MRGDQCTRNLIAPRRDLLEVGALDDLAHGQTLGVTPSLRCARVFPHPSDQCQWIAPVGDAPQTRVPKRAIALRDLRGGNAFKGAEICERLIEQRSARIEPRFEIVGESAGRVDIANIFDRYAKQRHAARKRQWQRRGNANEHILSAERDITHSHAIENRAALLDVNARDRSAKHQYMPVARWLVQKSARSPVDSNAKFVRRRVGSNERCQYLARRTDVKKLADRRGFHAKARGAHSVEVRSQRCRQHAGRASLEIIAAR